MSNTFREKLIKIRVVTYNGIDEFDSIEQAKIKYPDLDIYKNTIRFTWAMDDGDRLRFESWEVYNSYD